MSVSSFMGYACERSSLVSNEIMCEYENEMGDAYLDCDIECPRGQILQLGECVTEVDVDQDLDGVPDEIDNCLTIQNPDQNDCDQDGIGDACDEDNICGVNITGNIKYYDVNSEKTQVLAEGLIQIEGYPVYTSTSESGAYHLGPLSPGNYHVLIFKQQEVEGDPPVLLGRYPLQVNPQANGIPLNQDWTIDPPGDLVGSVKFDDKLPFNAVHQGIGVYIEGLAFLSAITDVGGHYHFHQVPQGEYTLRFVHPSYESGHLDVEVIGLSTVNVQSEMGDFLYPQVISTEWSHRVEVNLNDFDIDESGQFDVDLEPLFPHHYSETQPPSPIVFSDVNDDDLNGQITVEQVISHQPFEVFNLNFTDAVKRSSLYSIGSPLIQSNEVFSQLNSEGLPASWESYDDRLIALANVQVETEACEPQHLINSEFQMLPVSVDHDSGDRLTLRSINTDDESLGASSARPSDLAFPLGHPIKEVALSLTRAVLVRFDTEEGSEISDTMTRYDLDFNFKTEAATRDFNLGIAEEPCLVRQSTDQCESTSIPFSLSDCTSEEMNEWSCQISFELSKAYPDLRFWVYQEEVGQEIPLFDFSDGLPAQCLNRFTPLQEIQGQSGVPVYIPIYPLISRDIRGALFNRMVEDGRAEPNIERVERLGLSISVDRSPPLCESENHPYDQNYFPILEESAEAVLQQIPQPGYGLNGRPLIVQKIIGGGAAFDAVGLVNQSILEGLRTGWFQVEFDMVNPVIKLQLNRANAVCRGGACDIPIPIYYEATDGANTYQRFFLIHFMDRGNDLTRSDCQNYDFCWRFTERDICCDPFDPITGGSCF